MTCLVKNSNPILTATSLGAREKTILVASFEKKSGYHALSDTWTFGDEK